MVTAGQMVNKFVFTPAVSSKSKMLASIAAYGSLMVRRLKAGSVAEVKQNFIECQMSVMTWSHRAFIATALPLTAE